MATKNITGPEFKDTVHGEGITLVDFWASWCGPCMRFGPIYEKASEANPDITFAKVDTEAEQGLDAGLLIDLAEPVVACLLKPGFPFALGCSFVMPVKG